MAGSAASEMVTGLPGGRLGEEGRDAVEEVDRYAISERARVTMPTIRRALSNARMIGDAA